MTDKELSDPALGAPINTTTAATIQRLHDLLLPRDPYYGPVDLDKSSSISDADLEMIRSTSKMMAEKSFMLLTNTPNADRDPFGQLYSKAIREHANTVWLWGNPAEPAGPVIVESPKKRTQTDTQYVLDTEALNDRRVLTERDWGGSIQYPEQAASRVMRHRMVNAVVLPGSYASRNQREGHYAFKIGDRHTRKRRKAWPKIISMRIGDKFWESISGRLEKKRSDIENGT